MATTPAPIPRLSTIDDVVDATSALIDWSIGATSRLGYFAALYKRITIAVGQAIESGAFHDGRLMERFDVAFGQRWVDAVNGHFHGPRYPRPTRSWQLTFDAALRPQPIIVQHMLGGILAHILLDLGIVANELSMRSSSAREDFNTINAVLASQVEGIVEDINELSPALADVYAVLKQHEIFVVNETIRQLRDSAWRFGSLLAAEPSFLRPTTIWVRDRHVAAQVKLAYEPPALVAALLDGVADRESRDVVANLRALDELAAHAGPIKTTL